MDVTDLRMRFLYYLNTHGVPGQWLPGSSRSDMCQVTKAWARWGKHVVDPLLETMVADGIVEIRTHGGSRQVRLDPAWVLKMGRQRQEDQELAII